jgi:chorismate mutase / prephenate dehydratase
MLVELRQEISDLDGRIVELVARRQQLARRVGQAKVAEGLPVRDHDFEQTVRDRMLERAAALEVDPVLMGEVADALIRGAVRVQQQD